MIKQENTKYFAWNARQINMWQGHFHCSLKYELTMALSMKSLPYTYPLSRQLHLPVPKIPSFPWHMKEPIIWCKLVFLLLPLPSSESALPATIQLKNSFPAVMAWQLWANKELFSSLLPLYSEQLISFAGIEAVLWRIHHSRPLKEVHNSTLFSAREWSAAPLCRRKVSRLDRCFSVAATHFFLDTQHLLSSEKCPSEGLLYCSPREQASLSLSLSTITIPQLDLYIWFFPDFKTGRWTFKQSIEIFCRVKRAFLLVKASVSRIQSTQLLP